MRWVYSYDGLGRRVAKTCLNTDTGEIVSRQVFTYVGNDLVAEHTTAGDAATGVVGRVWVQDPGTGELVGQINLTNNNDAAGVSGWSQAQVDAMFYALVADLAGAPQELIDTEQGSVVGHVTQSLFGRRSWSGVASPVLFAGQYEDDESGWVYNRFRFYDPTGGVYGSQDALGVGPNIGTPQGYVHNPLTWVDALGLKAHKKRCHSERLCWESRRKQVDGSLVSIMLVLIGMARNPVGVLSARVFGKMKPIIIQVIITARI